MAKNYRDLIVWQKGMQLAKDIYRLTSTLPNDERFGLISQMRRAAVSIPSNIAEGHGKISGGDFSVYIGHARASTYELTTQLELCRELGFSAAEQVDPLLEQGHALARMLSSLMQAQIKG